MRHTMNDGITAIRIYMEDGRTMADIRTTYGPMETVEWTYGEMRRRFTDGIDAYTHFYDQRIVLPWDGLKASLPPDETGDVPAIRIYGFPYAGPACVLADVLGPIVTTVRWNVDREPAVRRMTERTLFYDDRPKVLCENLFGTGA